MTNDRPIEPLDVAQEVELYEQRQRARDRESARQAEMKAAEGARP